MDALTPDMLLVLAILAGAIILFVTEVVRIDVAAILIMVTVGLTGLVPSNELFAGFASNAVISIIAVMILGAALDRVGVMRKVAAFLLRIGGSTEGRIVALISSTVAAISAFMQNIGAAALFLPVTERMAERTGIPVSRLLMPMGFAAILGGTITLVASGPLILLNDLLASTSRNLGIEIEPLGLFTPTPIGLALAISGIALFAMGGRWLLPSVKAGAGEREGAPDIAATYGLNGKVQAFRVPPHSPLVGRTVEAIEAELHGVLLAATYDQDGLLLAPPREYTVEADITVGLVGSEADVARFADTRQLVQAEASPFRLLHDREHAGLAEIVVRPGSDIVDKKVREIRLRKAFGVTLLAIHRGGQTLTGELRQHRLKAGDVLIVFAPWDHLRVLTESNGFVVISEYPQTTSRANKEWWALGAFALSLGLVIFSGLQLSLALMVGAVIILISKTLTADEAYRAVSWKTVFLLAALIPLGQAVEVTGTAAWIAEGVISAAGDLPPWGMQMTIAVLATAFTLTISNVGATVLLVPLAANVAIGVDADPAQFGLIVALAASNAFLLPTHQVNALLMGPGNYRVADFLRAGLAMTTVFLIVLIISVNIFT
ncbi:MAG: SLC13 family permease [Bradymonadaceae bacterium]